MRPLATRAGRLGTETAFEVLAKARALEAQGHDIVHLEIGEPDFDTPPSIVDAGIASLRAGDTHYTPSVGIPELRAAIAAHLGRTRGVTIDPARIIVTPGAKPIMFYTLLALLEPGDEAIYPDPGFPIYASMIDFCGATGVPLPLREARDFAPDLDELRSLVTDRTKLLILNSPHNPTGGVLPADAVKAIAALARERDLWVLADEIYSEIIYAGPAGSIAGPAGSIAGPAGSVESAYHSLYVEPGMAERTILLDGFSKTFAMTGWRLGYGVFPQLLLEPVTKLVTNSVSCVATFVQKAGVSALEHRPKEIATMVGAFRERRDAVVAGLNAIDGISCRTPHGAFYVFPNVSALGRGDSAAIADRLLYEAGVATLAGTCFGAAGEGHLRLSYANSRENLEKAVSRIANWVDQETK